MSALPRRRFSLRALTVALLALLLVCVASFGREKGETVPSLSSGLLMVLGEHFDLVAPYRIDGATLVPAAPPTTVSAPHDAVWDARRRLLHVSCLYKEQPCIATFAVSADGALRRACDPLPTRDRGPALVALGQGDGVLCAWSGAHLQIFPLDGEGQPGQPTHLYDGVDALERVDASHVVTLRGGRVQLWAVDPVGGAMRPRGPAAEGGAGATALAVDPEKQHVFVLNLEGFTRHIRVLELTKEGVRPSSAPSPQTSEDAQKRLVCAPRVAYVMQSSDTIATYARDGDALAPLGKPVPTATGLSDLLVVGPVLYAVGASDPSIRIHPIGLKDGRLKRSRPVSMPRSSAGGLSAGTRILLLGETEEGR